jgi:two-component system phosphate regulon response regulator PhoB
MTRSSILLVEDDRDVADIVVETLESAGYEVDWASNGVEGLRFLRQRRVPKLILLDWSMPLMTGPEMLAAVQEQPEWRDLPVVLITAQGDAKAKAIALRADGYLKKPIDSGDLLRMVSVLIREHQAQWLRRSTPEEIHPLSASRLPALHTK